MRFFARSMTGLFLLAVTLGLLAVAGLTVAAAVQARLAGKEAGMPARERVFSAAVQTVEPARLVPVMTAFGEVRSRRTLELRSPRAGKVIWLAEGFEDGAAVQAGAPLLRLDPADAQGTRDLAAADRDKAQAEVAEADRALVLARDELSAAEAQAALRAQALARQQDLKTRGVGSDAAVETAALAASSADQAVLSRRQALGSAENRVALAATALARAGITLAEAERALRETELVAGFDGRLNGVAVAVGRMVGSNERLAELIDPDALEVSFRLSNAQYARLLDRDGQITPAALSIALDVGGAELGATGRITRVGAAVGEGQTGRLIYAALESAAGFRPGDFVTVRIEEPALDDVALLPGTAVGADGTVLILGEGDRLVAQRVEVLRRQDNDVIVTAGPLSGQTVVTERTPLLGPGIRIKPIRPGEAEQALARPPESAPELVELTPERRAELIAFVEANSRMPAEAKARMLDQLAQDRVPAQVIARLEQRMGG
jgi:multidrug efflux pump subunit AcrA (membrane-fusion protein)